MNATHAVRGFADRTFPVDPGLAHREVSRSVALTGPDGARLPAGAEVTVEQRRHAFGFGCIGFEFLDPAARETALATQWLDVFNTATLPFYWRGFEPEPGDPQTAVLQDAARWFAGHGVALKGHPLAWHTMAPTWLRGRPTAEVADLLRDRITRDVTDFAGLIDTWDAINEVVIMPVFDREDNAFTPLSRDLGRIGTIRLAFETARAANPRATLLLNDFDMSTAYECLIEGCLEAGIEIDVLGLQSHMHQGYWGEERTLETLDRFARYGLPLHLTETTLVSGHLMPPEIEDLNDYQIPSWPSTEEGEARQADEIVRHYRTLLSHPAVEAATYWGLGDAGAWLGAPGGLIRADGSEKPAYTALKELVTQEWWLAPSTLVVGDDGTVPVTGFAGTYAISAGEGAAGRMTSTDAATFELVAGDGTIDVRLGEVFRETRR